MSKKLNWADAHRRLEGAQKALQEVGSSSPAELEAVFRKRAESLARRRVSPEDSNAEAILVFHLGTARFGILLAEVVEVIHNYKMAPVPGGPRELAGLIQVRGEIRPAWNLRLALQMPEAPEPTEPRLLLLRNASRELGILVDRIVDIVAPNTKDRPAALERVLPGSWLTADFVTVLRAQSIFGKLQEIGTL